MTDDQPGDPLASLGDEIALGYGDGIAGAIRGAFRVEDLPATKRRIIAATEAGTAIEWPAGITDGPWETVSVHTLELPADWPPGCRCVLSDGERVSLGGPCPAHRDVKVASGGR